MRDDPRLEIPASELTLKRIERPDLDSFRDLFRLVGHRWLLAQAVRLAWREGVRRVHVHTCSLDHPAALSAYFRAGFTAYKRAIERFPDPRILGILPVDCAPQVPLLAALRPPAS